MWKVKKYRIGEYISSDRWLLISFWVITLMIMGIKEDNWHLHWYEIVLSLNSMALIIVVNYYFFPKFYEKDKIVTFIFLVIIGVFVFGYIEECLIERYLFYGPETYPIASPKMIFIQEGAPAFIFIVIKLTVYFRDRQILIDQLKKEKLESQLQFLKSQINPHILFNNLNNIYSLSVQNDSRTSDTVLKLSNLMRYVIYESSENRVLLTKELDYLQDYLELQKIQIEGRGQVSLDVSGSPQGYTIAPLLIIPFVENCFKHSMDTQLNEIKIHLKIKIEDGVLTFKAENSFTEIERNNITPSGVGLKNTIQRLNYLYPDAHSLEISQEENIFKVDLILNLI